MQLDHKRPHTPRPHAIGSGLTGGGGVVGWCAGWDYWRSHCAFQPTLRIMCLGSLGGVVIPDCHPRPQLHRIKVRRTLAAAVFCMPLVSVDCAFSVLIHAIRTDLPTGFRTVHEFLSHWAPGHTGLRPREDASWLSEYCRRLGLLQE